jgi:hypothetical protein
MQRTFSTTNSRIRYGARDVKHIWNFGAKLTPTNPISIAKIRQSAIGTKIAHSENPPQLGCTRKLPFRAQPTAAIPPIDCFGETAQFEQADFISLRQRSARHCISE